MPRKTFTAGETLLASDVNTYLMNQAVMVFDDSSARSTAIPSPSEGMVTYVKDVNLVQAFDGSDWIEISGGASVTVSETAPTGAEQGDLWFSSSDGRTFVYYTDVDGSQWVEIGTVLGGGGGATGADGAINLNKNEITADYTFDANYNGVSAGPITIASGVTVTVGATSAWSIV